MLNLDNILSNKNENKNNNWPFRMLIIGPSGSGKTNVLLHLISNLYIFIYNYIYIIIYICKRHTRTKIRIFNK